MSLVCVAMLRSSSVTLLQEENKLFFLLCSQYPRGTKHKGTITPCKKKIVGDWSVSSNGKDLNLF